jgi:hypothetical protein
MKISRAKFFEFMEKLVEEYKQDDHNRGKSFDHVQEAWMNYRSGDQEADDLMALNLAFYLASWGMYRGSSNLLQRDYKVFVPIVCYLKEKEPKFPVDYIFSDRAPEEIIENLRALADGLKKEIEKVMRPLKKQRNVTDTLLSKILMATLVSVPAFDSFVKNSLRDICKKEFLVTDGLLPKSLRTTIALARDHIPLLEEGQRLVKKETGTKYPLTKLLDLYLWFHGEEMAQIEKEKKEQE